MILFCKQLNLLFYFLDEEINCKACRNINWLQLSIENLIDRNWVASIHKKSPCCWNIDNKILITNFWFHFETTGKLDFNLWNLRRVSEYIHVSLRQSTLYSLKLSALYISTFFCICNFIFQIINSYGPCTIYLWTLQKSSYGPYFK